MNKRVFPIWDYELERQKTAIALGSQDIGDFLNWLFDEDYVLAKRLAREEFTTKYPGEDIDDSFLPYSDTILLSQHIGTNELLEKYYNINPILIEQQLRMMLEFIRWKRDKRSII